MLAEMVPMGVSPGSVYNTAPLPIVCCSEKNTLVVPEETDRTPGNRTTAELVEYGSYRIENGSASVSGNAMLNVANTPAVAIDNANPVACGCGFSKRCQLSNDFSIVVVISGVMGRSSRVYMDDVGIS